MLGLVLCGGKSIRMGTDKALLSHQDKLWAQLTKEKLISIGLNVKFSVNADQQKRYVAYFNGEKLIVDHAMLDIQGPLLGILSTHLENPTADLFLLACDLLLMEPRVLDKVMKAYTAVHSFEAYVFQKDGEREPLCGIYSAAGLQKVLHMLQTDTLTRHSMKFVLSQLKVFEIKVEHNDYHCFDNFNSHAEINGL